MNVKKMLISRCSAAMTFLPLLVCLGGTMGCELIAAVDRSRIITENSGGSGGAGGGGPQCSAATDCPGMDTVCQTRSCVAGACGFENAPTGTPNDMQTAGDCKRQVCDGLGALVDEADDTDVVDDQNECTMDVCNAGQSEHIPTAAGTPCNAGGGTVCEGMGACVECATGTDCMSGVCTLNACDAPTCSDGVKNQNETDVDCGGTDGCPLCGLDKTCGSSSDCASDVCFMSKCIAEFCGDGKVTGTETCDDASPLSGDGCSDTCQAESGYSCMGMPSVCVTTCGDGIVAGMEQCDDGDTMSGNGCDANCQPEAGFSCTGMPSNCTTTCGDGVKAGAEACDDGNMMAGDCCSAGCGLESGCEIEPNDSDAMANDWAMVSMGGVVKAFNEPASDNDVFSIVVPNGKIGTLTATVQDGVLGSSCTNPKDIDSFLVVRNAVGMPLGSNDDIDFNTNRCSSLTLNELPAGTYYVEHHRTMASPIGKVTYDYTLAMNVALVDVGNCGNGMREAGEECDDGNNVSLDGCAALCAVEEDYHCAVGMPDVCSPYESKCDDGMDNDGDGSIDAADTDCALPAYFLGCGVGEALRVYPAFDTPVSIPDFDGVNPGQASSLIRVVAPGKTISRAAVFLTMPHTYMGDVELNLIPPGGTGLLLTYGHGFSGPGYFDTLFDSSCPMTLDVGTDPFSDCYAPDAFLTGLAGMSSAGVWTLDAQDTSGGDEGTIDAWKLVLCVMP